MLDNQNAEAEAGGLYKWLSDRGLSEVSEVMKDTGKLRGRRQTWVMVAGEV